MRGIARGLIMIVLAWLSVPALAQFSPGFDRPLAELAFQDASQGHVLNVQRVGAIRGMSQAKATTLTIDQVAAVMARPDPGTSYFPGTRLLFYSTDGGQLSIWLIDKNGLVAASRQPLAPQALTEASLNLRLSLGVDGIARGRTARKRGEEAPAYAVRSQLDQDIARMSAILLPTPILNALKGTQHLMVIGGGSVTSVPFALLKLDKKAMLIDKMTVSVSPGLYDFAQPVTHWDARAALAHPLIIGNPTVGTSPEWDVPSLPGAEQEAASFAAMTGSSALIGPQASKTRVVAEMDAASLLYFAAHGVASPDNPVAGGFLMLAGDDAESGFLRAVEVQRRRLKAALVVLSACQSGLGMPHDGGMIGLTRAFRSAGVPRVVMSLWSVSDEATVVLMDHFQRNLSTDMPAIALRKAMLETRKSFPEPRYWAPFALYGTPR
jgi:hypothetical protein